MRRATVALPTLNEAAYIENCLDSIQDAITALDAWEVEVIVLDADSTDDTRSLARRHPVVDDVYTVAKGILLARHLAFEYATGEVVISIDADNAYDTQFLERMLAPFKDDAVVMTYGRVFTRDGLTPDMVVRSALQYGFRFVDLNWVIGANRAIRRDTYFEAGGYRLEKDGALISEVMFEEQVYFPYRLQAHGEIVFVPTARSQTTPRTTNHLLSVEDKVSGSPWIVTPPTEIIDDVVSEPGLHALSIPLFLTIGLVYGLKILRMPFEEDPEPVFPAFDPQAFAEDIIADAFPRREPV